MFFAPHPLAAHGCQDQRQTANSSLAAAKAGLGGVWRLSHDTTLRLSDLWRIPKRTYAETYSMNKTLRGDRNQCGSCGQYFNSTHAFEKHRTGDFGKDRRCMTADEMSAKGMFIGDDGFWRGSRRDVSTIATEVEA